MTTIQILPDLPEAILLPEEKERVSGPGGETDPPVPGDAIPELPPTATDAPAPNDDPHRRRIFLPRGRKWTSKLFYFFWDRRPGRPLTKEELARASEMRQRAELERTLRSEANAGWSLIRSKLTRLGLCYRFAHFERSIFTSPVMEIKRKQTRLSPEVIYYEIDMQRMPRLVYLNDLAQPKVVNDLSATVRHRVSIEYNQDVGCWIKLERGNGYLGIPSHVNWSKVMDRIPPSADGLTVCVGIGQNNRPVYRSFGQMYHMLIGGVTRSGKSVFLSNIIGTLVSRNNPKRLKLILIDLKGGLEFSLWEGIPHLQKGIDGAPAGICTDIKLLKHVLAWEMAEADRRMAILSKAKKRNIGSYNQANPPHALPHLFVIIDELASVMELDRNAKENVLTTLRAIGQKHAGLGIHLICCTQVPKKEVIDTLLKNNLPAKICFSMPSNVGSMLILDNGAARGLQPAGRCVFQWGTQEITTQCPYLNDLQVFEIATNAILGKYGEITVKSHDVTDEEIMQWSLADQDGWLIRDTLFARYQARGLGFDELTDWLRAWEGQEFVIGSSVYTVEPARGTRGRRLVAKSLEADAKVIEVKPE